MNLILKFKSKDDRGKEWTSKVIGEPPSKREARKNEQRQQRVCTYPEDSGTNMLWCWGSHWIDRISVVPLQEERTAQEGTDWDGSAMHGIRGPNPKYWHQDLVDWGHQGSQREEDLLGSWVCQVCPTTSEIQGERQQHQWGFHHSVGSASGNLWVHG